MEDYVNRENIGKKARAWLEEISEYNQHHLDLSQGSAALLVIDMQNYFLQPTGSAFLSGGRAIIPTVKNLIEIFREAGRPVIYTRHVHHPDKIDVGIMEWWWEDMCLEDSQESEVHHELEPQSNEKEILKHRYSAFYNTDLETILRCQEISDLVVTGVMTNLCCESTTRDAYYRDYKTFFLADGTATVNEQMHLASLTNLAFGFSYVTTSDEITNKFE